MEKYIRKIIHLKQNNSSIYQLEKRVIAYFKIEKRNSRIKITLSVDGVTFPVKDTVYFCLIIKDQDQFKIRKIKPIVFKGTKIEEMFYIDNIDIDSIQGGLILDISKEQVLKDKILLAGFEKEPIDFNLLIYESLEKEVKSENKYSDADKSDEYNTLEKVIENKESTRERLIENKENKENKTEKVAEYKEEKLVRTDDKGENKKETVILNDDNQKSISELKDTRTQNIGIDKTDVDKKNASLDQSQSYRFNDYKNYRNQYQNTKRDNEENKDIKSEVNENTIEYIKKQLEVKEEIGVIDELFANNQRLIPFEYKEDKTEWIRIDITDLVFLPLESWMLINNAFLMTCYRKYKHLILGRNFEEKVLKLGIPDIYYFKESLVANVCGFNEFYPSSGSPPKAGEYGYWIIKTKL